MAQSAVQDAYCEGCTTVEKGGSSLPFTGLEIGLVLAAGGAMLAVGFGVRRLSRTEHA